MRRRNSVYQHDSTTSIRTTESEVIGGIPEKTEAWDLDEDGPIWLFIKLENVQPRLYWQKKGEEVGTRGMLNGQSDPEGNEPN